MAGINFITLLCIIISCLRFGRALKSNLLIIKEHGLLITDASFENLTLHIAADGIVYSVFCSPVVLAGICVLINVINYLISLITKANQGKQTINN